MNGESRVWVVTDRRYLAQRMPAALADWLSATGVEPRIIVADEGPEPARLSDGEPGGAWRDLRRGDLVVVRSRHPLALALAWAAEALGARTLNSSAATSAVRNKVRCALALARAGIPTPETRLAGSPRDLAALPESAFPLVLKPHLGDNGSGIRIVESRTELGRVEWREPLVLAQRYVEGGGIDLKLYVAGEDVWAVRRASPLVSSSATSTPVPVDEDLRALALDCGRVFGLLLYGVDVVESGGMCAVVDVNEFPNYTGVPEATAAIGRIVLAAAGARQAVPA